MWRSALTALLVLAIGGSPRGARTDGVSACASIETPHIAVDASEHRLYLCDAKGMPQRS